MCLLRPSKSLNFILYCKTQGRKALLEELVLLFLQERKTVLDRGILGDAYLV